MKWFLIFIFLCELIFIFSCDHSILSKDKDCFLSELEVKRWIKSTDSLVLERAKVITYEDSMVANELNITLDSILRNRIDRINQNKKHNNWQRASNYLGATAVETEIIASSFGFESPYYFSAFLKEYSTDNICREQLLMKIREFVFSVKNDSMVYNLSDSEVLTLSFRIHAAERHVH